MDRFNVGELNEPAAYVALTQFDSSKQQQIKKQYVNTCYHIAYAKQWETFFADVADNNDDDGELPNNFNEYLFSLQENNKEN